MLFLTRMKLSLLALALAAAAAGAEEPAGTRSAFVLQSRPTRLEPFRASPLQLNPPTFRWPAEKTAATSYRIELSRDASFGHPRKEIVSDLWYRPLAPLEAGQWFWRCRPESPATGEWLGPESFTLPPELPRWPVPAWGELIGRVPATHPRIYVAAADVAELRANARRLAVRLAPWQEKVRRELGADFSLAPYQARVPAGADPLDRDAASQARKKLVWESKAAAMEEIGRAHV